MESYIAVAIIQGSMDDTTDGNKPSHISTRNLTANF